MKILEMVILLKEVVSTLKSFEFINLRVFSSFSILIALCYSAFCFSTSHSLYITQLEQLLLANGHSRKV